jgi:hypothetical protein
MSALATFIPANMEDIMREWQKFAATVLCAKGMDRKGLRNDAEWILPPSRATCRRLNAATIAQAHQGSLKSALHSRTWHHFHVSSCGVMATSGC